MLRIGLLKYDMTEKSGGERVASLLSGELAKFYRVHLISVNGKGEKPFYPVAENVIYAPLLDGHQRIRKTLVPGGKAVRRYVREQKIDILLSIGGNVNAFLLWATAGTGVKTVFCEHLNLIMANQDKSNALLRRLAVGFVDRIVTLTEQDRQAYLSHYHLKEDRVLCIYNWMDEELGRNAGTYDTASKRIITVGRFEEQKGYDLLIPAAKRVFEKHPDWQWDIYGDGALFQQIQSAVAENGLQENLHLMGATRSVYDKYTEYAFYVMTSRLEGLPMVLLEAKAKGLPIVSFNCLTGPAEIVRDGVDGYLVPPEDVQALAERICQMIEQPQQRAQFSACAGGNTSQFSKEKILRQWRTLLESLCK